MPKVLITPQETRRRCGGISRSQMFALIARGAFPLPIHLSVRRIAFLETEIDEWIQKRIDASRAEKSLTRSAT